MEQSGRPHGSIGMELTPRRAVLGGFFLLLFVAMLSGELGLWPLDTLDRPITDAVPALRSDAMTSAMLAITALGDSTFLIPLALGIIALLVWKKAYRTAIGHAVLYALTPLIVKLLKTGFARPRPTVDLYGGVESFSFPSGHATNSAVIYGSLAILAFITLRGRWRAVFTTAFALLPALIAFSRIYVGAHWPSDVLAGVGLAGALLTAFHLWETQRPPPRRAASPVYIAFAICALLGPLYIALTLSDARAFYTMVAG